MSNDYKMDVDRVEKGMVDFKDMSYYDQVCVSDLVNRAERIGALDGFVLDGKTQKYKPGQVSMASISPWIMVHVNRRCDLCNQVFNIGRFLPSYAQNCWKIVVKLWRVDHFFWLLNKMEKECKGKGWECKVGLERRAWTNYHYGGYFYTNDKNQGLKRYNQVKEMLDEGLGKAFWEQGEARGVEPLVLKRYCTEFEYHLGPSDQYKLPAGWEQAEKQILDMFDTSIKRVGYRQPEMVRKRTIRMVLSEAWHLGDMTCLPYNNGRPFYPPSVTYHNEKQEVEDATDA